MIRSALVLPTPRALLPPFSQHDPVADLRKASTVAVMDLLDAADEIWVVAAPVGAANRERGIEVPLGHRVARHLIAEVAGSRAPHLLEASCSATRTLLSADGVLLVMADGSARRHEKAPGHLHPAAIGFDQEIQAALERGDAGALSRLDPDLAGELWCEGVPSLRVLGAVADGRTVAASLTYADAPHGVAWWVARWDLG